MNVSTGTRPAASRLFLRTLLGTTVLIGAALAHPAAAQTRVVSACSGVHLPRSVVTGIVAPVVTGITAPIETTVNGILALPLVGAVLPPLNTNVTGLLTQAASGAPITLQALDTSGNVVGPADQCRATSDSISLNTPAGISIGGNQIAGLGSGTASFAADLGAVALGNNARAEAGATGSLALGANSNVTAANSVALGAGSVAARGALGNYTAVGLPGAQSSAGEVSVGSAGGLRQITNVAAGSAATDVATVGQVSGVADQVGALASRAVQYDDATRARATLAGAGGTVLGNVGAGAVTATSTEAVNGAQLFATNARIDVNVAAIGALDTRVTNNTTAITTAQTDITTLQGQTANAVRYDTDAAGVRTGGVTLAGVVPGQTVVIGNVGAGALAAGSTQAVNGSQLFTTNQRLDTTVASLGALDTRVTANTTGLAALSASAAQYDGAARDRLTLAGASGTVLANIAPGALSATSGEAVNGAQLFATNTQVVANTAGIGALDTRVTTNTQDIASLQGSTANAVRYDVDAAGVRTGGVTLAGVAPGQTVVIGNVGAGALAAGSTQAVNGSQLFATNTQVATNTTGLATLAASAAQYDGASRDRLTLAGASGTVLANVGAGTLSATSGEAVNGAQLFATNAQVAANTAAIAQVGNGSAGPVRYSTTGAPTTPNGGTVSDDLTLVGASGRAVALHNVAGGTVAAGSTDAVNGGQLNTTNQAVATLTDRVTTGEGRLTTLESAVATNTTAIGALDARVTTNTSQIATNTNAITTLQTSVGSTNAAVTNLTTRVDGNSTAITNLQAQVGNAPLKYADAATPTTPNGGAVTDDATLVSASGGAVGLHNIRNGVVAAGSTDAVNGGQLAQTNGQVAANTSAIASLANVVTTRSPSAVQYTNAATPTTPNGGVVTNDVALVGANGAAPVGLHNIAAGVVATGSTDAVNGGQLASVATQSANSLQYDRDASGARTNQVTLAGGNAAAPVTLANVGAGTVAAGSTQAVNGGQLYATNQTAQAALALGSNAVQYNGSGGVTLQNAAGTPVALRNVAAGTSATDAVNVGQLQSGMTNTLIQANDYTNTRLAEVGFDLADARRDMSAGTSSAMAVAALPQVMEPGATMVAVGGGTYRGQSAIAIGASRAFNEGRAVLKVGGTYDSRGYGGANAGVGFQF